MGAVNDIGNKLSAVMSVESATYTTDPATITGIDMQGSNAVVFYCAIGESGDTLSGSVKIDLVLQESDDDSTYTDVTDTDNAIGIREIYATPVAGAGLPDATDGIFQTIDAAAEDSTLYAIGYRGTSRYCRVLPDFTGTHSNGCPLAVVAVRGMLDRAPNV